MAIAFDLRTAVLVCSALTFLIGVVLALVQMVFTDPFRRSLRWWTAGLLLQPLGFILLGLRGAAPDWLSIVAANGLIAAALACGSTGLRLLLGARPRGRALVLLVGAVLLVVTWFTYAQPSVLARVFLVSLLLAAIEVTALLAIYHDGRRVHRSAHLVGGCFALAIVSLVYRAFYVGLVAADSASVFMLNNAPVLSFGLACVLPQVATVGFLLLCAERSLAELQLTSRTDYLTAVMNGRAIEDAGRQWFSAARRHGHVLSVLAIDVDNIKRINDELGRAAGDEMLVQCVERVRASMRQEDLLGRLGGGEFVVLMSDTDLEHAALAAERIRRDFSARTFSLAAGQRTVSVSLGVATLVPSDGHFSELLRRADRAMYAAKEAGRDRTMVERDSRLCAYP